MKGFLCYDSLVGVIIRQILVAVGLLSGIASAHAQERGDRWVSLALNAGNPGLFSGSIGLVKVPWFEVGFHFGFAPIDPLVQTQIRLSPVALALDAGQYSIHPRGTYSMTNFGGYVRILPFEAPWYLEIDASYYNLGGSVTGDLRNSQTNASSSGAVSGSVFIGAPALSLSVGRHFVVTRDFFFTVNLGVTVPIAVQSRVTTGSNAAAVLPLVPGASSAFDTATNTIQQQVEEGVAQIRSMTLVLPALTLGMGFNL